MKTELKEAPERSVFTSATISGAAYAHVASLSNGPGFTSAWDLP